MEAAPAMTSLRAYAYPNPARGTVGLVVPAHAGSRLRCDILDAAGRRVRQLGAVAEASGWVTLVWDGRDDSGLATAPGLYLGVWHDAGTGAHGHVRVVHLSSR